MPDENTPSGRIIAAAQAHKVTKDARGRSLAYRRLGALDRARLFKAIGPANATNAPYLGMAMLAASVVSVDEMPMIFPTRDAEIEAAISRLDDDGIDAVATALARDMYPAAASDAEGASQEAPGGSAVAG
jgi:hypothetical protein